MSKIVTAVNAMVSNSDLISDAIQGDMEEECFFKYDKKHLWSIIENSSGKYFLHYYPGNQDINVLASIPQSYWENENIKSVVYTTEILGTKEALSSFKELNTIVREKVYGMDNVLDDIIGNGEF